MFDVMGFLSGYEPPDRWTELTIQSDGVSVTLYEETPNGPSVVDEMWFTTAEFEELQSDDSTHTFVLNSDE